jgi:hypothetical protein
MLGHIPKGQIPGLAMAGETSVRFFPGIGDLFAEDKDAYALFTAFFHVGAPRPMAGFTGIPVDRAVGDLLVAMNRLGEAVEVVLMAAFADLGPHNPVASPDLSSGQDSTEQNENGQNGKKG